MMMENATMGSHPVEMPLRAAAKRPAQAGAARWSPAAPAGPAARCAGLHGTGDAATPRAVTAAALRPSRRAPRALPPSFNAKREREGQEGLSQASPEMRGCQTLGNPKHFTSPTASVTPEPIPTLEQTPSTSTPKSQVAPVISGWKKGGPVRPREQDFVSLLLKPLN